MGLASVRRILSWVARTWPRRSERRHPVEEVHAFFAERLTRAGQSVAGLWLGSLFLAMFPWNPGGGLLFALTTAALGVSLVLTARGPRLRLVATSSGSAVEGEWMEWRATLENPTGRVVEDAGAGLFRAREGLEDAPVEALVASIPPGGAAGLSLRVRCLSRGPTGFAGAGVVRRDPLGLARARAIDFIPVRICVAPAPQRVAFGGSLFRGPSGRAFAEAMGIGDPADRVFQSVRPFREGDRLRDLDHKSWARWNQPVVREYAGKSPRGIALSVETCCDGLLERSLLEPMIRLAAGLADQLCRRGVLALLVVDGIPSPTRCDDPVAVRAVFAAIPRCGWGAWPRSSDVARWTDPSSLVVRIGVSAARWSLPDAGTEKRLAVVDRRRETGDPDLVQLEVSALDADEVVI